MRAPPVVRRGAHGFVAVVVPFALTASACSGKPRVDDHPDTSAARGVDSGLDLGSGGLDDSDRHADHNHRVGHDDSAQCDLGTCVGVGGTQLWIDPPACR